MMKFPAFLTALLFSTAQAEQFISLNLCSDRLLIELAEPHQIAAMSPHSKNPLMMLDKVNYDKPTLEPQLSELLPYLDKTILINTTFYPQLVASLQKLNVKIVPLNDTPQTPEQLFALIEILGEKVGNPQKAQALIARLKSQNVRLNQSLTETLILTDTGVAETEMLVQYWILLDLLGLKPLKSALTSQNFSLEKLLLSQPNKLIVLSDKQGYNAQAELLTHPILQHYFKKQPLAKIPLKYTYCFDHGLWQGAKLIYSQLK